MSFFELIKSLSSRLGFTLTNLSFSNDNADSDQNIKEVELTPSATDKLKLILEHNSIIDLSVWSADEARDKKTNLNLYGKITSDTLYGDYNYAYIQFPFESIEQISHESIFPFVKHLIVSLNDIFRLDYALVTRMDDGKLPSMYFHGIYNPALTQDEIINLATWQRQNSERKTHLRGLYWGNLMGKGHLSRLANKESFIAKLKFLLGENSVATVSTNMLFFLLPDRKTAADGLRERITELLEENNLLMHPNSSAMELATRLV